MKVTLKNFQISIGTFNIFKCPKCRKNDIKEHYKYCPHCGVALEFEINYNQEVINDFRKKEKTV
jgi:hypothetical protein